MLILKKKNNDNNKDEKLIFIVSCVILNKFIFKVLLVFLVGDVFAMITILKVFFSVIKTFMELILNCDKTLNKKKHKFIYFLNFFF